MKVTSEPETLGSAGMAGSVAPPYFNPRFQLLDSLRAIASMAVLITHTAFLSGAVFTSSFKGILAHLNVGVTLFFLISGFVLYRPFVNARVSGRGAPSGRRYASRRFMRIAPAYWLALTVLAVTPGLPGVFSSNWWVYYGLLQPYPVYDTGRECVTAVAGCGIAQTWSLSIEVAFYLVLPIYALAMARLTARLPARVGTRADLATLTALGIASAVLRFWAVDQPDVVWMYGTLLGHFFWFALGMGLAVVSVTVAARESEPWSTRFVGAHPGVPLAAGAAGFLLLSMRWLPASASPYDLSLAEQIVEHVGLGLVVLAAMLPAVFGHDRGGTLRSVLGNPALQWLGQISYGIFLWHLTIMFALAPHGALHWIPGGPFVSLTVVTTAVTLPIAAASYYFVERPLMRMTWRRRRAGPVATVAAPAPRTAGA